MNQSRNCMMFRNLFETQGIDKLFLKIGYSVSSIIIVIANTAVIRALVSQRCQTREQKMFILLSTSDIVVGIFTVPFTNILFYTEISEDIYCKLFPVIIYAIYTPVNFSWTTTIVIALDRILLITLNRIHVKYMTGKILCYIFVQNFLIANLLSIWSIVTVKYPPKILDANPFTITLSVLELTFIIITASLYIYLLHYVRKKARVMKESCYVGGRQQNICHRATNTIAYVLMFLVTCNVAQLVGMTYATLSKLNENVVVRNSIFWPTLALYLNSFLNAVILGFRISNWQKSIKNNTSHSPFFNRHLLKNTRKEDESQNWNIK